MKKVCLAVLPALTIVLELLPFGAVCIFATSPTERVKETFSYFSLTPFGYANFAPLITATLTVAIFLLSLFSLKKKGVLKALFVLSIITVVISLLPLMYGLNYYTLVGALITVTLVIESILAKMDGYPENVFYEYKTLTESYAPQKNSVHYKVTTSSYSAIKVPKGMTVYTPTGVYKAQ